MTAARATNHSHRRPRTRGAAVATISAISALVATVAVGTATSAGAATSATTGTAFATSIERVIAAVGSTGYPVKDVQIRLARLGYPSGVLDGIYDAQVTAAVRSFLQARGLPGDGTAVRMTAWSPLVAATNTPIVISKGTSGVAVKELQWRLKLVGHFPYTPNGVYTDELARRILGFQRASNVPHSGLYDTSTRDRLKALTYNPKTFDSARFNAGLPPLTPPVSSLDSRCRTGRVLCVSKNSRILVWMVNGVPRASLWARFGGTSTPTREGTFSVYRKKVDVISNLYGTPMPYSMFFSGGQAVHYSSNFARLGYAAASHGCVNIKDLATLKRVYAEVAVGNKVVVYK